MIMDIDLKVWGPYAGKVALIQKRAAENRAGVAQPKNRTNFEALHKKQNINFLQDINGKRGARGLEMQGIRKERRSEMFMKGRKDNILANRLNHEDCHEISDLDEVEDNCEVMPKSTNMNSRTKNGIVHVNNTRNGVGKPDLVKSSVNSKNVSSLINKNNTGRFGTGLPSSAIAGPSNPTASRSNVITDSRRDQLSKWKREKAAADLVAKKDQKAPFKAGVSTIKPATNAGLPKNSINFGNGSVNASRLGFGGKAVGTASTSGVSSTISRVRPAPPVQSSESLEGRRVTRAMTKGQPAQPNSNVILNNRNGLTAGVKPAITKMTTLTISGKTASKPGLAVPGSSSTSGLSQTAKLLTKPVPGSNRKVVQLSSTSTIAREDKPITSTTTATIQKDVRDKEKEEVSNLKVQDVEKVPCVASVDEPKKEAAPKKKAKPKPIDETYIEYNAQFSTACLKLKAYSEEWTKFFEGLQLNSIPQDVEGDIQSALGKVKLLLDSKLPQFGELLFSYLCPQIDTTQILACDLVGWWDVASIQLRAVDTIFEGLHKLKEDNWVKVAPVPVKFAAPSLNPNDDKLSGEKISRPRIKSSSSSNKTAASGGLKAFLANKRKMINNNAKTDDAIEVKMAPVCASPATNESSDMNRSQDDADKTFDGGFFSVISSPMRTPVRTPSRPRADHDIPSQNCLTPASAVPASLRTPGRRRSSTGASLNRMSMCILGVRKSMGSFNKIGVKPVSAEDQDQNEKCNETADV